MEVKNDNIGRGKKEYNEQKKTLPFPMPWVRK